MSRNAPALTEEQTDLVAMLDTLMSDADTAPSDERPAELADLRARLAGLGVWTLGVPETLGGGGADEALTAAVFACLGRRWAALGWAAVQAHAAAGFLAEHPRLRQSIHRGEIATAVTHTERVDAGGTRPHVIVLGAEDARLYEPDALEYRAVAHTGLDGVLTRVIEPKGEGLRVSGDLDAAKVRLRLGAAAVAAGIADAASEAALDYSAGRTQFGSALTALPTVRDSLLSSSGAAAVLLRQVLQSTTATPWQAAAVLDTACESAIDAAAKALQSHGGYGYLTEYPAERLLRDAVSLRAAADTAAARRDGAAELASSGKG